MEMHSIIHSNIEYSCNQYNFIRQPNIFNALNTQAPIVKQV